MARLSQSGWELNESSNNVEIWSGVASLIQSTVKRSGNYALRISSLASGTPKGGTMYVSDTIANGPFFFRVYFRVATLPSAANTIMRGNQDLGALRFAIKIDSSGALSLFDSSGQVGSASSALSLNTWYRLEVEFNVTSTTLKARIDGVQFAGTTSASIGGMGPFQLGGNLQSEAQTTGDWYFDDFAVNNNSGTVQNSYPGDGSIIHLKPNAAGDNTAWTPNTGDNYAAVDEETPDNATSYVGAKTSGNIDDYNIEATPAALDSGATINAVAVGVRFNGAAASANASFVTRIKKASAGTVSESSPITPSNATWNTNRADSTEWHTRFYPLVTYQDPDASSWTKATLDTAQIGARISTTNTNNAQITALWASVDYTPTPDTPAFIPRSMLLGVG